MPPATALARHFDVSRSTMGKALHQLAAEGLLEVARGRRARIKRSGQRALVKMPSSRERLHRYLSEGVESGRWSVGEALPKSTYLAARFRVSPNAVVSTMRELAGRGLATRMGRRWVAGAVARAPRGRGAWPHVLPILQDKSARWLYLYRSERTMGFCRTFSREAESWGIRMETCLTTALRRRSRVFLSGPSEILRAVDSLGTRYLGTLIAGSSSEIPDMEPWVKRLSRAGRRVVWFDRYGEALPPWTRRIDRTVFTRCYFSEERALLAALRFLAERGHRRVGYFTAPHEAWAQRRGGELAGLGGELKPGRVEVIALNRTTRPDPESWRAYDEVARRAHINLDKSHLSHRLLCACLDLPITALIAPNDMWGAFLREVLIQRAAVGARTLSVISFDNSPESIRMPLTTVDFGFDALGYKALHFLTGDIPIRRDPDGDIPTEPFVVDRNSVEAVG